MSADAIFSTADLERVADLAAAAWRVGAERDWSAKAGTLEWTCAKTADHAVDTVLAPAFFLASRKLDGYPALGSSDFTASQPSSVPAACAAPGSWRPPSGIAPAAPVTPISTPMCWWPT